MVAVGIGENKNSFYKTNKFVGLCNSQIKDLENLILVFLKQLVIYNWSLCQER